jgi:protein tyrosine/serine phosphatase
VSYPHNDAAEAPERTYWILPDRLLGGAYPGAQDAAECSRKIRRLLDTGIRTFIDLTESDESHKARLLVPYEAAVAALAGDRSIEVSYQRHAIRDLNVPTPEGMVEILAAIELGLQSGAVYVHCLGGVGRTGTVAACWLLDHGDATVEDVFHRLTELRQMDRVRGNREAPEEPVQRRFVRDWAARKCPPDEPAPRG